jgi:hypothetical protein
MGSQSAEHKPSGGGINEGFGVLGLDFIIFSQTPEMNQPREGALHNPAFGKDVEAGFVSGNNLQPSSLTVKEIAHPCHQLAGISAVGKDDTQPPKVQSLFQNDSRPVAILDPRSMNDGHENQAKGIHQEVTLAAYHLLACIVAAFSGLVSHFNRLRVEDPRSRGFFFPCLARTLSRRASLNFCHRPSFCHLLK